MLNWISSAWIVQAGPAGPLYVNTKISMTAALTICVSVADQQPNSNLADLNITNYCDTGHPIRLFVT